MASLEDIINSKVRIKLLKQFFRNPREIYHIRAISRDIKEEVNAIRRELERFEKAGMIRHERRGNRIYYWPRKEYLMYGDFLSIIAKTTGLGARIIENRIKIGKPSFVMFSGRFVRYLERKKEDDVDILVVGSIVLPELAALIRAEESRRGHEINYTVMSRDELEFRKRRRDPFLLGVLSGSRVMIIGDEEDLVS